MNFRHSKTKFNYRILIYSFFPLWFTNGHAIERLWLPLPLAIEEQQVAFTPFEISILASDLESIKSDDQPLNQFEKGAVDNARKAVHAFLEEDSSEYAKHYDPNTKAETVESIFNYGKRSLLSKGYDFNTFKYLVSLNGNGILYAPFSDKSLGLVALSTNIEAVGFRQNIGLSVTTLVGAVTNALSHRSDTQPKVQKNPMLTIETIVSEVNASSEDFLSLRTGELYIASECETHRSLFNNQYHFDPYVLIKRYYDILHSVGDDRFDPETMTPGSIRRLTPQEAQFAQPSSDSSIEFVSPLGGDNFLLLICPKQSGLLRVAFISLGPNEFVKIHNHNFHNSFSRLLQLDPVRTNLVSYWREQCPPVAENEPVLVDEPSGVIP
jgi:hypothetical protein